MLDLDAWQEVFEAVRRNRLRTLMTAAGVFWGTFMLLLMLGFGGSLEQGIAKSMRGYASNAVYIWGGRTRMPYRGLKPGREVDFDNDDIAAVAAEVAGIEHLAPRNQLGGHRGSTNVTRKQKTGSYRVGGDVPDFWYVQPMRLEAGRFLDDLDLEEVRKVAVIGTQVRDELFERGEDPLGEWIQINSVFFLVVGVIAPTQTGDRADRITQGIHVPFSTFQRAFNRGNGVGWIAVTAAHDVSASAVERDVRAVLARRHRIHPEDRGAIGGRNAEAEYEKVVALFAGIRFFVWVVGLATLASGVVGVSNIMLIIVKERTQEIGIRRALGATPAAIVGMVVQEAVVLTCLSGYAGLIAGVALLEAVSYAVGPDNDLLGQPSIDLQPAMIAAVVLVVAGALAGVLPAQRAVSVHPVDALRAE